MILHRAIDVGGDAEYRFQGNVPRRGDFLLLGAKAIRARVISVEWTISEAGTCCAAVHYEKTE